MKNVILGLVLISTAVMSSSVMACQQEAQFIGTVTNYSTTNCSYEINYSMFNSSYVCPLDIDEAVSVRLQDKSCSLKNGDQVSGVLVRQNNEQIVLE